MPYRVKHLLDTRENLKTRLALALQSLGLGHDHALKLLNSVLVSAHAMGD
jgi:hypothetical protein